MRSANLPRYQARAWYRALSMMTQWRVRLDRDAVKQIDTGKSAEQRTRTGSDQKV